MTTVEIMSLAYVGFETQVVGEWPAFATEIFGFQQVKGAADDSVYLKMDSKHHRIALHPGEQDRITYIGWELRNARAFDDARTAIEAAGYPIREASDAELEDRAVAGMFSVIDPAGFRHEFMFGQSFQIGSFYPGRPMNGGFVADAEGLGHVVLVAEVTDKYRHFLSDVLGLRTYADFPFGSKSFAGTSGRAVFMRCNARTHCLAVMGIPGLHGVQHVAVEARSINDVGVAYDLVQERRIPLSATLGSHTIDPVVSFYTRTPTGFDLEYAWGGIPVTDDTVVGKPSKTDIWGHKPGGAGMPTTIRPLKA